jgi:hypothetical protein
MTFEDSEFDDDDANNDDVIEGLLKGEKRIEAIRDVDALCILTRTDLERAWVGDYGRDEYPDWEIE